MLSILMTWQVGRLHIVGFHELTRIQSRTLLIFIQRSWQLKSDKKKDNNNWRSNPRLKLSNSYNIWEVTCRRNKDKRAGYRMRGILQCLNSQGIHDILSDLKNFFQVLTCVVDMLLRHYDNPFLICWFLTKI